VFQKAVPTQDITNPVSLPSFYRGADKSLAAYFLVDVFSSLLSFPYLSFNNVFQKAVPTQDITNPVSLPSFYRDADKSLAAYVLVDVFPSLLSFPLSFFQ